MAPKKQQSTVRAEIAENIIIDPVWNRILRTKDILHSTVQDDSPVPLIIAGPVLKAESLISTAASHEETVGIVHELIIEDVLPYQQSYYQFNDVILMM